MCLPIYFHKQLPYLLSEMLDVGNYEVRRSMESAASVPRPRPADMRKPVAKEQVHFTTCSRAPKDTQAIVLSTLDVV